MENLNLSKKLVTKQIQLDNAAYAKLIPKPIRDSRTLALGADVVLAFGDECGPP